MFRNLDQVYSVLVSIGGFQETIAEHLSYDLTYDEGNWHDEALQPQYPHVKRSLQKVFECAYAQLVLPWYVVPEPCERQPLHQVLSREIDFVIDRIIERAKDFDVCQAVVGSIRVLTQYLHNARHSDREVLFSSREEEMAVLREFSDALVRNLFSKSLWGHEVNRCALNEIVALKGLGHLVTWLSDPDNLNQLVVSQLDSVTPKGSVEELCASDPELASLASQEGEGSEVSFEEAGSSTSISIKGKRKSNKLKEGWSKFVDKIKTKKAKKKKMKGMEQRLVMRLMSLQGDMDEDDVSSREGSVHSQQDSDGEDKDLEKYLTSVQEDMMEFKLSYEMWCVGCWLVSIPHVDWDTEELIFTVHLEEKDSPENLQWDIRKSYMDIIYFRNRWQDSTNLPSVLALDESEINDEVKEKARLSVEHFLQELMSDNLMGHTQPVFQFLCPLEKLLNEEEHYGGVWGLLSGLAYILTPGQEEDENSTPQTEDKKEIIVPSPRPAYPHQPFENPSASTEKGSDATGVTVPSILISQCKSHSNLHEEAEEETETEKKSVAGFDSSESCSQDSDNPLTSHFKMIFRGLTRSRSQESLALTKNASDEDQPHSGFTSHCSQNGGLHEWPHFNMKSHKKEKICSKGGSLKPKGKDQGTVTRGEDSQVQKSPANREQLETTKAMFDLLKEISGNSILINIFDTILKPFMPILKKKVNTFLDKLNPTETQMAAYVDTLRDKLWPESPAGATPPQTPRTDEDKNEARDRAHNLINAKYSNYLVLKKTDMESVFNLLQNSEENKTLVYMLLSFLFHEFFPNEHSLHLSAAALHKVTNSST
ncbi:uncharacterized protein si:rp71-46j2.7 [Scomber japonicus]|uniref:uncharacterized protein si:rp71-46j2.7 n=1 Tax=Scomber japonicus TaxID=13676 RepID=UPI002306BD88|nr:uncharacterized protein si:rp71-46j2.7 [Scomber japonicus]